MVPGIDGGIVFLGEPTSGMSKQEMSDLIELLYSFGAEHGVEWADSP
jgi:ABC-type branched-subunit amino acid transport system ATPase component